MLSKKMDKSTIYIYICGVELIVWRKSITSSLSTSYCRFVAPIYITYHLILEVSLSIASLTSIRKTFYFVSHI
jgi:hypothetical protein